MGTQASGGGDGLLEDRTEAGRRLAGRLGSLRRSHPIVLGIPRGGVVVAAPIAAALDADLEVLLVRKVGAPNEPEYGLGAVAEDGTVALDERRVRSAGWQLEDLAPTVRREQTELAERAERYRHGGRLPALAGRTVVVVDDGVATGGTMEAAIDVARAARADRVVVALGVAPPEAVRRLAHRADEVLVLRVPESFEAVGQWYRRFEPVPDPVVLRLLDEARARRAIVR